MLLSEIVNEEVNAFVLRQPKKYLDLNWPARAIVHPKNDFVETSVTILLLVFVVNIINDIFNVLHDMGLQSMFLLQYLKYMKMSYFWKSCVSVAMLKISPYTGV